MTMVLLAAILLVAWWRMSILANTFPASAAKNLFHDQKTMYVEPVQLQVFFTAENPFLCKENSAALFFTFYASQSGRFFV